MLETKNTRTGEMSHQSATSHLQDQLIRILPTKKCSIKINNTFYTNENNKHAVTLTKLYANMIKLKYHHNCSIEIYASRGKKTVLQFKDDAHMPKNTILFSNIIQKYETAVFEFQNEAIKLGFAVCKEQESCREIYTLVKTCQLQTICPP